jgi:hypothetical protein
MSTRRQRSALLIIAVVLCAGLLGMPAIPAGHVTDANPSVKAAGAPQGRKDPGRTVVVYYFHGHNRCSSCIFIEEQTRIALQTSFAQALKDGRLVWRPLNVELPENRHFVKDYQLYTKSVIVAEVVGGREVRWKNLPKVWEFLMNKSRFHDYIRSEVQAYLG